ncbi:hypothetical protein F7Q92_01820 [Ideonella dechloratans]|uniref:Uncharacterized protein n=1 Tax=Ideonella dechloratans TaxID=36863 RepID=A0A643FHT3_IDEDE|nr:hypothetical protein [Ideonella dechloratans]KAB0584918.1 hypothetical protein F7Q92_01820 [Ideonella dechloratans]UFU11573.1 hypothetical protein LRM40_07875 [Ideonella dechloratans]
MIRAFLTAVLSLGLLGAQAAHAVQPAKTKASKSAHAKAAPKPEPELVLPDADGPQNAAAALVDFGHYDCEFSQTVNVVMNPKHAGYVDVTFGKNVYTMKPVLSSTGAVRLEDVRGKTLMLQIAYKSMLMDTQVGRRLVDECVSQKQLEAKKAAEGVPQQALLVDPNVAKTEVKQ